MFPVAKEVDDKTMFSTASKSLGGVVQTCELDLECENGSSEKDLHEGNQPVDNLGARDAAIRDNINVALATVFEPLSSSAHERGKSRNLSSKGNDFDLDGPVRPKPRDLVDIKMFESEVDGNAQLHPISPVNDNPPSQSHAPPMCESNGALMLNQSSPCKENLDAGTAFGEEGHNAINVPFLKENSESAGENDMLPLAKLIADSSVDLWKGFKIEKEPLQLEVCDPAIKASPIRALALEGKGKDKALSDVDLKDRALKEKDDSYESVESRNSARLTPGGRKRPLSFEQQLIVGTKRVKRLCQQSPNSTTSFTRCSSSFMNWMSTMIKGLPNTKDESVPFLTLPHNMGHESQCSKDKYFRPSNMGFQSIFRSLYQETSKFLDEGLLSPDKQLESCMELEVSNKPCEAINAARSCQPYDSVMVNHVAGSSDSPNQCVAGGAEYPSVHLKTLKGNFSASLHDHRTNNVFELHISNSSEQDAGAVRGPGSSHNSTLVNLNSDSFGGNGVGLPSREKLARDNMNRSDPLNSLRVTHLCSEACSHITIPISFKQNASGPLESGVDQKFTHNPQSNVNRFEDLNIVEYLEHTSEEPSSSNCKKLRNCTLGFEAHTTVESVEVQKVINPIAPSQNSKSSEAMASIFAKKLDAFKHILASDITEKETLHSITCFFCGLMGHNLRDCPQVTKTEREELLTKVSADVGAEASPCLCIRCFQLNHWAVACPNVSLNKPNQLERSAPQLDRCNSSEMKDLSGFGKNLSLLDDINHQTHAGKENAGSTSSQCSYKHPSIGSFPDLNLEMNATATSAGSVSTSILEKVKAPSHKEIARRPPGLSYMCLSLGGKLPDTRKGIFKAVKRLRLSRSDIPKWIASPVSISHLNGYYLRLRLGKSEKGLGGTGYYVACITGLQGDKLSESCKNPIPVMVRGMRCLVESHNISNQDFLEGELMAWWSAVPRDGGKVPSEDDLRLKYEERRRLGF